MGAGFAQLAGEIDREVTIYAVGLLDIDSGEKSIFKERESGVWTELSNSG